MKYNDNLDKFIDELNYIHMLFIDPNYDYFRTWTNPVEVQVDMKGNSRTECSTKPA